MKVWVYNANTSPRFLNCHKTNTFCAYITINVDMFKSVYDPESFEENDCAFNIPIFRLGTILDDICRMDSFKKEKVLL